MKQNETTQSTEIKNISNLRSYWNFLKQYWFFMGIFMLSTVVSSVAVGVAIPLLIKLAPLFTFGPIVVGFLGAVLLDLGALISKRFNMFNKDKSLHKDNPKNPSVTLPTQTQTFVLNVLSPSAVPASAPSPAPSISPNNEGDDPNLVYVSNIARDIEENGCISCGGYQYEEESESETIQSPHENVEDNTPRFKR